ncbi:hypothetical protein ACTA71_002914 [Dictyostelium dimigraforme]
MIKQRTDLYTTTGVVKSIIHGNILNISFNRNIQYQYRQISNTTKNRSPRVLNLKENGTAIANKLNETRQKGMKLVQKKDIINAQLNVSKDSTQRIVEDIQNISLVSVHKEQDHLTMMRSNKRMLLKIYFDQVRINNLKAVNSTFTLKKRVLNRKKLFVTYSPKVININNVNFFKQLVIYKQQFRTKWALKIKARSTKSNFIKTQVYFKKQNVRNISKPLYMSLKQEVNKKLQKLQQQKAVLITKAKLKRFNKQKTKVNIRKFSVNKYLEAFVAGEEEMEAPFKTSVDPIMSSILTNYTEKAKSIINKNVQQQVRLKEHLQFSQIRRLIDINHENEVYKNKELKKRDEKKLKKNIQLNFIKTVVIAAITKKTQQIESKKELILKVLLNILRRKGEVPFEGKIAMLFPYLKELGRKQGDAKIKNLALNLQMRIVTDLLNYKGDKEVKRNHVALVRNRIDYLEYMSQNPRKARGQISDYKAFWKAKSRGRMMYAKLTEQKNMLEQAALKNNYNILNNIIESEKKLYKLRLPKQRVTVPTLYQVYERVINHIKGLETRTQGEGFKNNLKKKNMFLVLQNLSTKHIDTTVTARQEYYRIYHPKEIRPIGYKKENKRLKSTALKPLGPIGTSYRNRLISKKGNNTSTY